MKNAVWMIVAFAAAQCLAGVSLEMPGKWAVEPKEWGASNVVWRSFTTAVPREWSGRRVFVEIPGALHKCDAVVWVNGEKAGDILRPGCSSVEATRFVRFGSENEIRFCLTESGAETARGATRAVTLLHRAKKGPAGANPRLVARQDVFIADVFANTSWRRKRCDFEVEIDNCSQITNVHKSQLRTNTNNFEFAACEQLGQLPFVNNLSVSVFDSASNLVWRSEREIALTNGVNKAVLSMPWDEKVVAWEFGRPALYTAVATLSLGHKEDNEREDFANFAAQNNDSFSVRFGFREVWREGREIMMNGHKAHFRLTYPRPGYKSKRPVATDVRIALMQSLGYNMRFNGHTRDAFVDLGDSLDAYDEAGMGCMQALGDYSTIGADSFHRDPAMLAEYRRFAEVSQRRVRNHPSFIVAILSSMSKTEQSFSPGVIGQRFSTGDRARQIALATEINHEFNPNSLCIFHADGVLGDIANGNVYLNWTPAQERDEWLCEWSRNGVLPWCNVEFLQPYPGDWFKNGVFLGTEYLAALFGDRAYAEESSENLKAVRGATAGKGSDGHGSREGAALLVSTPLFRELKREWQWRDNSRWRAWGLNGGSMWFDIGETFGLDAVEDTASLKAGDIRAGRPAWASAAWDWHRLGNLDFCGFIGGAPEFADRTHAYRSGEKIEKSLVLIWDGIGEKTVKAELTVDNVANVKMLPMPMTNDQSGVVGKLKIGNIGIGNNGNSFTIPQGERVVVPISFVAPDVAEKTTFTMTATFTGEGIEQFTDTFDFEVWPSATATDARQATGDTLRVTSDNRRASHDVGRVSGDDVVCLFDPSGDGAKVLDAIGVKYGKIDSPAALPPDATHLVVGRDALAKASLDSLAPRVAEGLRVFIMRQTPETWRKFGFRVQDLMLRETFARDRAFALLPQDAFREWRGTPDYPNAPFGKVMSHSTQRGPRGSRRHTVAGLVLQTPEREGYIPLVVGGFDLNYSALLRYEAGCGDITYCTLDFEGRVGICPAATATAKAVFGEFLGHKDGKGQENLVLVENLEDLELLDHLGHLENLASLGLSLGDETTIYRAAIPDCVAFRGVGPGDVRWPSGLRIRPLRGEGATPDGAFAVKRVGGKTLVFAQIPRGRFAARAVARDPQKEGSTANAERLDEGRVRRLYARLRTNCENVANVEMLPVSNANAQLEVAGKLETGNTGIGNTGNTGNIPLALRRALHQSGQAEFAPLPAMHVLGPFAAGKDNSKLMLDTAWTKQGEAMAIAGDFDPNHEFPLPQGGTANWRPILAPDAEGCFDFAAAQPAASFPVTYAICHVERKGAGDAILKLGGDWRFRVWCNGAEVFRTESGARLPRFEVKIPLKAGDNVLAFKVGAGSGGHKLIALLEPERELSGAGGSRSGAAGDAELDSMTLYDDDIVGFDPCLFHYW